MYGYSQFITNVCFALLFFAGTVFMLDYPELSGENVFIAIFSMFFGAFGAGQATSFGPDIGKATSAAIKIFKIVETPTEINALDPNENAKEIEAALF